MTNKAKVFAYPETISRACGLGILNGYRDNMDYYEWNNCTPISRSKIQEYGGGTGYNISNFIPEKLDKLAYEEITSKFPIKYQSTVRVNENSGNKFFFIVFDAKGRRSKNDVKPHWPFKSIK